MFAFLKFVVAAVFLGFLAGCATTGKEVKQPEVSPDVQKALAGRTLKEMPIYVKPGLVYYDLDGSSGTAVVVEVSEPLQPTAESGKNFLKYFVKYLRDSGFKVVDSPCKGCLEMEVGFMYDPASSMSYVGYASVLKINYNNIYILMAGRGILRRKSIFNEEKSYKYLESDSKLLSEGTIVSLLNAWEKRFGKIPTAAAGQ